MMKAYRSTSLQLEWLVGEMVRISPRLYKSLGGARYPRSIEELGKKLIEDIILALRNGETCKLIVEGPRLTYQAPVLYPLIEFQVKLNGSIWETELSGDEPGLAQRALNEGWQEIDLSP